MRGELSLDVDAFEGEGATFLETLPDQRQNQEELLAERQYQIALQHRSKIKTLAEAVKEKQASSKPGHTGRIAKVLRPGYRYMINDDNFKIVRTAQVKLFD